MSAGAACGPPQLVDRRNTSRIDAPESQPLSFDDAQILRLESATIMGHTTKALVLSPDAGGRALEPRKLRERVAERLAAVPRLQLRLVKPTQRHELPAWEHDAELDLDWHVAASADAPLDDAGFRDVVGELMGERLDHERPLWRLDVVALAGERTGVVGRIHHALADGVTAIRVLSGLLWDEDEETAESTRTPSRPAPSRPTPKPRADAKRSTRRLIPALERELRPGAHSPFDHHIGPQREVAWATFPLERIKAIEHAAGEGVTVNDVVLAAVAGALRVWIGDSGEAPRALRAQIPVSLHLREGSGDVGNKDSFLNVDLPIDEPEPRRRLMRINAETRERKLDHDAETLYAFFHALGHFKPLYKGVTRITSGPREFALSVSNVPGPRDPVLILGHELGDFCSFAEPADRHALRVSIISIGGSIAFGFCSDPEAIGGVDRIAAALDGALAELEQAD